jgi:ATP synthase F1 complex assembly factor 2
MQNETWLSLISQFQEKQGQKIITTQGIASIKQSKEIVEFYKNFLENCSEFDLAGFEKAVISTKSFFISYALYKKWIDIDFAAKAARLEVLHQINKWGEVQDAHDTDREELKRQLGAISLVFMNLQK